MAIITVTLIQGRSAAQKADLLLQLTSAVVNVLGSRADAVRVVIDEVPAQHFAVAGVAKSGPSS